MTARLSIENTIADAGLVVQKRHDAFFENPHDPETNHKLRVSIRTLRSLVDFLRTWEKDKQNALIRKDLKTVVKGTSRLRELDVLCEMVRESGTASEELVNLCAEEAACERARVLKSLKGEKQSTRLARALKEARKIRWKKAVASDGLSVEMVRLRFDELANSVEYDLNRLDEADYERMHETRKRVKQVRYVSDKFSDILGDDAQAIASRMKAEQDRLGALCDAQVNRSIVEGFLARGSISPALAQELARIVCPL